MTALRHNDIVRSISRMTIQTRRAIDRKSREADAYKLAETEQQFQIPVSGTLGTEPAWATSEVQFEEIFYVAPYQRDNQNPEPQVTYGYVRESGAPVIVTALVDSWVRDPESNFIGANIMIGTHDPGGAGEDYAGRVHMTFQGYSAPRDTTDGTDGDGSL
jgi:hypothetical protein